MIVQVLIFQFLQEREFRLFSSELLIKRALFLGKAELNLYDILWYQFLFQTCITIYMRTLRTEPTRQELQQLLKKLLHQNGMCLMIYPEGSNTSLMTALAETIHANQESLHQKLVEKLQHDRAHFILPRKLGYIYEDPSIVSDFKKHPELVQFTKIILQLFSASTQRRLNLFSLLPCSDSQYNLTCLIINEKGYTESISIARISNKYYNINQQDIQSKNDLSLQDVFKSSVHIDSDELIETFKSQRLIEKDEQKIEKVKVEEIKSSGKIDDLEDIDLNLKRAKSHMPYREPQAQLVKEYDNVSLGEKLELNQAAKLIHQCVAGGTESANFEGNPNYHPNIISPEMYYYYYQNPYYAAGKSENYMSYPQHVQIPIMPHSPTKSPITQMKPQSPVIQPINNYYPAQPYQAPVPSPIEATQRRYAGRLKFFDDAKNYGFIIMDLDESDIFVHYDDLQKAGISKQIMKSLKNQMYMQIRFNFKVMDYFGKYKKSRKAVELIIIDDGLGLGLLNNYPLPE